MRCGALAYWINAVQGARIAGARNIVAIDPVQFKRDKAMELGATHTAATVPEAAMLLVEPTRGQMADSFIVTTDVAETDYVGPALDLVAKRGKVIITAVAHPDATHDIPGCWSSTTRGSSSWMG